MLYYHYLSEFIDSISDWSLLRTSSFIYIFVLGFLEIQKSFEKQISKSFEKVEGRIKVLTLPKEFFVNAFVHYALLFYL